MKNKELSKFIKQVQDVLSEFPIVVAIGGSYSLKHYYGVLDREPEDIDIILTKTKPDLNMEAVVSKLQTLFLHELQCTWETFEIDEDDEDAYESEEEDRVNHKAQILLDGKIETVNFLEPVGEGDFTNFPNLLHEAGYPIVHMLVTLEAKLVYNRSKDRKDIEGILAKLSRRRVTVNC